MMTLRLHALQISLVIADVDNVFKIKKCTLCTGIKRGTTRDKSDCQIDFYMGVESVS